MKVRLWFIRETDKARLYSRLPPDKRGRSGQSDTDEFVWIPRSVIEHTLKLQDEHHMEVADWFADKHNL